MTIHAFTPALTLGTNAETKHIPAAKLPANRWPKRTLPADRLVGAFLFALVLGICCASALTGGLSVSTGGVEMNLTGSLSQGMQIHFAAIGN